MRVRGLVALLMLVTGCATTRVVNLDTGQEAPIVYTPVDSDPVEISEEEFKNAVTQLVLDLKLNVALNEAEKDERRSLLASAGGIVDGAQQCRVKLVNELGKIGRDLTTAGTKLRKLIMKDTGA